MPEVVKIWLSICAFILCGLCGLAGKGAEFVSGCGDVPSFAELGASCTLASCVDSASEGPPILAASCASVACCCGHGETCGDVVGFEDVHFVWELGWVGGEGLTKTDNGDGTLW